MHTSSASASFFCALELPLGSFFASSSSSSTFFSFFAPPPNIENIESLTPTTAAVAVLAALLAISVTVAFPSLVEAPLLPESTSGATGSVVGFVSVSAGLGAVDSVLGLVSVESAIFNNECMRRLKGSYFGYCADAWARCSVSTMSKLWGQQ